MVLCFTGRGGINFNEVRYTTLNECDFIYNIPAGRMVIDEETGRMIFTYAWLYFMSRSFEIPIGSITQYKLLEDEEEDSHPFYRTAINFNCYKTSHRIVEIRYNEGPISKRATIKIKNYNHIIKGIENYLIGVRYS